MTRSPVVRTLALAAIGISLWLASGVAQNAGLQLSLPMLLSETANPGIDRGINEGPPRPARTATSQFDDRAEYVPGSVIVKFRNGTSAQAQRTALNSVRGIAATSVLYADFDIVTIAPDDNAESAARRLSALATVEYAQARYRVRPLYVPNDPLYSRQWNLTALDMERAWDINQGASSSIIVAVLDSGVAYRSAVVRYNAIAAFGLPALGPVDVPFAAAPDLGSADRFVAPRDFIWGTTTPYDFDGHGTHVAGTIGQATNNGVGLAGMAFNVRIMPVKVIDGPWDEIFNSPFIGTDDTVARGIRYAVDNGARIINMSIGRTGPPAPAIQEAINYAVTQGAFVVVAGGNEFKEGNPLERIVEFAPQIRGMVSVAAVGRDLQRAAYSSTGSYMELAAPGGDASRGGAAATIYQQTFDFDFTETFANPSSYRAPRFDVFAYQPAQGTSMAAPHVSGLAALLMQQGIKSPAAIEAAMERYARDLGPAGKDHEYGYGLISPRATLRGMGLTK